MRYIDADHFADVLEKPLIQVAIETRGNFSIQQEFKFDLIKGIVDTLRTMPAADVAPVVHAKWIPDGNEYRDFHCCSACDSLSFRKEDYDGYEFAEVLTEFCPNCGAKMDVETPQTQKTGYHA